MKLSVAAILLIASTSSVSVNAGSNSITSLLQSARRLEDADADDESKYSEYSFLQNYNLKMITCTTDSLFINPAGTIENSTVVFRLCPKSAECSDDGNQGCSAAYGDYVTGLNTFVQEYLEDKRDDMQNDDNFKVEELGECREYEADKDGVETGNLYYVGPACTDSGVGVKLGLFIDDTCSTAATNVTFEDISNGISLPYSDGGLVANFCESCNNVNFHGELSDFCMNLYMYSGRCETNMENFHASGKSESSCEAILTLTVAPTGTLSPSKSPSAVVGGGGGNSTAGTPAVMSSLNTTTTVSKASSLTASMLPLTVGIVAATLLSFLQ